LRHFRNTFTENVGRFNAANDLVPTFTSVNSATFKENIVRFGGNYKF
jgi:hypothetical protein